MTVGLEMRGIDVLGPIITDANPTHPSLVDEHHQLDALFGVTNIPQAFFIDEGFGSLDAEALDLAMEGVERVVGEEGDRLVVVVSHVPEMRARLEDLIVLGKDEVTGATVVHRA